MGRVSQCLGHTSVTSSRRAAGPSAGSGCRRKASGWRLPIPRDWDRQRQLGFAAALVSSAVARPKSCAQSSGTAKELRTEQWHGQRGAHGATPLNAARQRRFTSSTADGHRCVIWDVAHALRAVAASLGAASHTPARTRRCVTLNMASTCDARSLQMASSGAAVMPKATATNQCSQLLRDRAERACELIGKALQNEGCWAPGACHGGQSGRRSAPGPVRRVAAAPPAHCSTPRRPARHPRHRRDLV